MLKAYKKAPVVEAVIEFRLGTQLQRNDLEKIRNRLISTYPFVVEENQIQFSIGQNERESSVKGLFDGFRLNSNDLADAVFVRSNSLAISRLAPYIGWQYFIEKVYHCRSEWIKVLGNRSLARLGLRYVNRIDIPANTTGLLHEEEYLNAAPRIPVELIPKVHSYAIQTTAPLDFNNCTLILNSGTAISPLINHFALSLDIDISCERDIPEREDELRELIEKMRVHKNRIFEGVITERSRELFS